MTDASASGQRPSSPDSTSGQSSAPKTDSRGRVSDQVIAATLGALADEMALRKKESERKSQSLASYEATKGQALSFLYRFSKVLGIGIAVFVTFALSTQQVMVAVMATGCQDCSLPAHPSPSGTIPIAVPLASALALLGGCIVSISLLSKHSWGQKEEPRGQGDAFIALIRALILGQRDVE